MRPAAAPKRATAKAVAKAAAAKARQRVRRKPAAKVEDTPKADKGSGKFKILAEVEASSLMGLGKIWLKDAMYYLRPVEVAGEIVGLKADGEGRLLVDFRIHGTQDDGLLREMSGKPDRIAQVHVCPGHCPANTTGEAYLHGRFYKKIENEDYGWFSNLVATGGGEEPHDELEKLRAALAAREREIEEGSPKKKKKKKEKKRKEGSPDKEEPAPKKSKVEVDPGQKDLAVVYGGTALDPDLEVRSKHLKKARRLGQSSKKKKKKKSETESSGSGSSSSSSTDGDDGRGLFEDERKMKLIWKKCPGSLAATAVMEARENLVSSAGTMWGIEKGVPPILTQYGRVHLLPNMSPSMGQETLTLCVALDYLLQGKVAGCADLLAQRVKSLESTSRGSHWAVSRQLELVRSDFKGITDEQEALQAARRAREESKLRNMTSKPPGSMGSDRGPEGQGGKGKRKDAKGNGKYRANESGGGKGDGRKDDKGGWQKKS